MQALGGFRRLRLAKRDVCRFAHMLNSLEGLIGPFGEC